MSLTRRQLLRGALGTAVALPLLNSISGGRARAIPPTFPKRLVVFFTPHGTVRKNYLVSGTETAFELAGILAPLVPHKSDLIVLKNVDLLSATYGPGDSHQEGMGALLSGIGLLKDPTGSGGIRMDDATPIGWGGGISLDQHLARTIGKGTKIPSLELGVHSTFNQVGGRISYLDAAKPVPPVNDPALVFDRLFKDFGADPIGLEKVRAERKSVLDGVRKQFARLDGKLSKDDKVKIDAHFTAVREMEERLAAPGGVVGGACVKPTRPSVDASAIHAFPTVTKLQIDLMVMAMACDLTRVATLMMTHAGGTPSAPWLGITESHHQLSHAGNTDEVAQEQLTKLKTWYAEQFAYLLTAMKSIPEGSGTMLDNSIVLWGSELSQGNTHGHDDVPFVLAGKCGGYFKTGRFVQYGRPDGKGVSHNNMLVSIAQAMGLTDMVTFGKKEYCSGPLSGLAG